MTVLTRVSNGISVSLGNQIASSGEGEVWETNERGYLAKIYHSPTRERIEKLKVMLANPPADPMKSQNHVSIAFPQDLLKNQSGAYVGFLMPTIGQSRELTTVYNPSLRRRKAPGFNWYYLHATALNTAWIIQSIHEKGYILGDIKPQNILVNDRALVAVIDTDSFQVRDDKTGKVYRCTVGSEGFTPVELLSKDLSTTNQTEIHDRFRLAVLIHYLLFGYHPFSGQWVGSGDSPEQNELIRKGFWYGGQNSLIHPSLNTIPLDVVHPEIKRCFLKCFNDGHTSPHLRPTAEDWHNALEVAINELTVCGKVNSHCYSQTYGKCYWCERAGKLGVDIFPFVPGIPTVIQPTITQPTVIQIASSTPINQASKLLTLQPLGNSSSTVQPNHQQSQKINYTTLLLRRNSKLKNRLLLGGTVLLLGLAANRYWQSINPTTTKTITNEKLALVNKFKKDSSDAIAISSDGETLVTVSGSYYSKTSEVWNFKTGKLLRTFKANLVKSVAISPDGQTLVSGGLSSTIPVKVWNFKTGELLYTIQGHHLDSDEVFAIAISPDGNTLVTGGSRATIKVRDLKTGELLLTLKGHSDRVRSLAISPDGRMLVSGSDDNTIKLWNLKTGQELRILKGHSGYVYSLAISPDGQMLASGSWDSTIKIWNLNTGEELHTLKGRSNKIFSIAFSPDGETLVSGGDKSFMLWSLKTKEKLPFLIDEHLAYATSVAISPNGKNLVVNNEIWRLPN